MSQNSIIPYLYFLKNSGISHFLQDKPNFFYSIKSSQKENIKNQDLSTINNLNDLEILIKKRNNFTDQKLINDLIIGEGNKNAEILIIGEYPEIENQEFKIFKDQDGTLLNKMLKAINLNKDNIYITNTLKWPSNKNDKFKDNDIINSLPFLQRQIEIINPKIMLLMGDIPAKTILNLAIEFNNLRGKWHKYRSMNIKKSIKCLVTYSPHHLISNPDRKKDAWEDLKTLEKEIHNEN